ncbi:NmrA family NAD(P)-binding protein [Conexibacter stalactiti]|uniref:NmrA family NAD(P)-binding protein n=1 Tax=Conexibacter stalactiti TaxID=1940611 RepID=A0ABU4HXZ6_9ACTN|nr:NmrA family NAD(P)-binding protein [Conexibacter stalactiti]MDW5598178.1 NmrA family NAD(P)-binding protein [Conexibacter stalactiti]MEC5038820.1 NmrA family NAD(P)-binding protein [Conexibacter stalactiti]
MTTSQTITVLGGTGKTGRRLAARLRAAGADVRTAARSGADVRFDWHDPATHAAALDGADALYLVPPALRLDYPPQVAALLDRAEAAGVRHVTLLSARGVEHAPAEAPARATELDLIGRAGLTHAILRPGWFMQNFSEYVFQPAIAQDHEIAAPTGDGAEAFVHADDIAEVAAATLLDPAAHAGQQLTLTGPEALTFAEVAERISTVVGGPVVHVDLPPARWLEQTLTAGVPRDYAELLLILLSEVVRSGANAATTDAVERVTGHPPRSFADYLADPATAAAWAPAATPA